MWPPTLCFRQYYENFIFHLISDRPIETLLIERIPVFSNIFHERWILTKVTDAKSMTAFGACFSSDKMIKPIMFRNIPIICVCSIDSMKQ